MTRGARGVGGREERGEEKGSLLLRSFLREKRQRQHKTKAQINGWFN